MKIRVESHSGYKADERPKAFLLDDRRLAVLDIEDRWYDPSANYFRVVADDGKTYLLKQDLETAEWDVLL